MTGHGARRWVVGRGLLGEAVARARPDEPFRRPIRWADPAAAAADLIAGVDEFCASPGPLEISWCAGRGVTSTPRELLEQEVAAFRVAIERLGGLPAETRSRLRVFLASSVGGAYAGSASPPFTEHTPVRPASAYGEAKLAMEEILREATRRGGWRSCIGRITNIYGPGQDAAKGQGLISVVVAGSVARTPISIYVSLDTLRDYIYEDDCARIVDASTARLAHEPAGTTVVKIIGSMQAVSIGAILGENARLRRRRPPVVLGQGASRGQAPDLRVRSVVWPDLQRLVRTTLPEGIDAIHRRQLAVRLLGRACR